MGKFHESLIEENRALIERLWNHPVVTAIGSGSLQQEKLSACTAQIYLLIRTFEQGLARLASLAPDDFRRSLMDCLYAIHEGLESFEEATIGTVHDLRSGKMSYETEAIASHMLAAAHTRPLQESAVAVFSGQYALLNGWRRQGQGSQIARMGTDIISLFGGSSPADWLGNLARFIDRSAETSSPQQIQAMRQMFPFPVHYMIKWWNSFQTAGEE